MIELDQRKMSVQTQKQAKINKNMMKKRQETFRNVLINQHNAMLL
jgi:hypothetical protein